MTSITIRNRGRHLAAPRPAHDADAARARLRPLLGRLVSLLLMVGLLLSMLVVYGMMENRWYKVVGVVGDSMSPTIEMGDLILITRPEVVEVGDIGVFQVDQRAVTHRIIGITADGGYLTQGDANPIPDDWEGAEVDLVGIYRFRIPWLGRLLSAGTGAWFTDGEAVEASLSAQAP
jgi:signal peptidase I